MNTWLIGWANGTSEVEAEDQHAAWNTLRGDPLVSLGLLVTALRKGRPEDEKIAVHTTALLLTWGRDQEARTMLDALRETSMDSEAADLAYAFTHGRTEPFLGAPDQSPASSAETE